MLKAIKRSLGTKYRIATFNKGTRFQAQIWEWWLPIWAPCDPHLPLRFKIEEAEKDLEKYKTYSIKSN